MEILEMTLEDLEIIKDILQDEFDDFWNYNILKKELESENTEYIVAKNKKQIVGFAGVQFILNEADITNIVTKRNNRNLGIGTQMLEKLIEISREKNMKTITLEVNENNKYAIKLYEKFKFEIVGKRKKYYNGTENAILMTLEL